MRIPDLNPDTIPDLAMQQIVIQLPKLIEAQAVDIAEVGQEHLVEGLLPAHPSPGCVGVWPLNM